MATLQHTNLTATRCSDFKSLLAFV